MVDEPEDDPYVRDPDTDFDPVAELSAAAAEEQVKQLRAAIDYHDYRYYVANDPVVADSTYDALFDRLQELEDAFDLHDPNSPTQRVGGEPVDELETVEHVTPMLSLQSSGDEQAVREWVDRVERTAGDVAFTVEPKFDGFSVEVVYEDGALDRAVTRGNGREGEDVTRNVRTIHSVPLRVDHGPDLLALRGEIYMPRSGFTDLNERRIQRGEEPFANPRNAAAGTVRQHDPSVVADRPLDVYFYDVLETTVELSSQREAFDLMRDLGLRVVDRNEVVDDAEEIIAYRAAMVDVRDDLEYDTDGVVAKVDDFAAREQLGATARHPRWAFAYKFPPKTGETTVRRIVVQVGRTGKLTPVALLDPVDVRGVTISRATLHNQSIVEELGVAEGARVRIERAGDVIPEVDEVVEGSDGTFEMPGECPVCGSEVVAEGKYHYCTGGVSCPAQLRRSLQHYCSPEAMDVEGVGERVADLLVDEGIVRSVADLYDLGKADLVDLERFAEQSAENLLAEVEASKDPDLASFLFALGIRHVGSERARVLASQFTLDELREASVEELEAVEDVGPEVAESIHSFFESDANLETLDRLLEAGVTPRRAERGAELSGLTLVVTGSIPGFTREELTDLLERHGADVTSSVSGRTDYLVVGENPGQTKVADAEAEGVEQLDVEQFDEEILSRIGESVEG